MRTLPSYDHKKEYESKIHEFRVARGFKIEDLKRLTGGSQSEISALANGTISPLFEYVSKRGEVKPLVKKLVKILNASIEDLFPRYFCALKSAELLPGQVQDLSHSEGARQPIDILCRNEQYKRLNEHIKALRPRLQRVLFLRFYCNGSLQECGQEMGISRERFRQLESKALRLLKHKIDHLSIVPQRAVGI